MKEFWLYLRHKIEKNFHRTNVLHELGEVIEEGKKNWIRDKLKMEVLAVIEKKIQGRSAEVTIEVSPSRA